MMISIKNPAPLGDKLTFWGDYHFGLSLQKAIQCLRPNAEVRQDYWPEWERDEGDDAILVIRGKRRFTPPKGKLSFLWLISHPASLTSDELEGYTAVLVASETLLVHLRSIHPGVSFHLFRQCTDAGIFYSDAPLDVQASQREGIYFVANSRGVEREIVTLALSTGLNVDVIGRQWDLVGLNNSVSKGFISNDELPDLYRKSAVCLNDHWGDMRHWGFINNRIFDALACGLPIFSDTFPELKQVIGSGLTHISSQEDMLAARLRYESSYTDLLAETAECWQKLKQDYTFDARAEALLELIDHPPAKPIVTALPAAESTSQSVDIQELHTALLDYSDQVRKKPRVLHLVPAEAGSSLLFNLSNITYITAGPGEGPWQVVLDTSFSQLQLDLFDLVVLEDLEAMNVVPELERFHFLRSIISVCGLHSQLLLPKNCAELSLLWQDGLNRAGFELVHQDAGWLHFQPPTEIRRFQPLRALDELKTLKERFDRQASELAKLSNSYISSRNEIVNLQKSNALWMYQSSIKGFLIFKVKKLLKPAAKFFHFYKNFKHEKVIAVSGYFNGAWYLDKYPDVSSDPVYRNNPLKHFMNVGAKEGRSAGPDFNTRSYLDNNPDVAESGVNPLIHYIQCGRAEGRKGA